VYERGGRTCVIAGRVMNLSTLVGRLEGPRQRQVLADTGVAPRPRFDGAADRDRRRARGPGRDRHRQPGGGGDLCQTAIADGLQTGLHVIAAGVLLAITAALALPNRRISTATT
jgi:hypothetical protein